MTVICQRRLFQRNIHALATAVQHQLVHKKYGAGRGIDWHEVLGIEVELAEEKYRVFLQSRHDHSRWEVARLAWNADFDDASNFLETLRQQSANNDPGYANLGFDLMLDSAATSADPAHRREILEKSEQLMLADTPIVPLYFLVSKRPVNPYVQGAVANPTNRPRSHRSVSLRKDPQGRRQSSARWPSFPSFRDRRGHT